MLKINPLFQPPRDYVRQKPFRKLYIPQKEYPNYNFIGALVFYVCVYVYVYIYG